MNVQGIDPAPKFSYAVDYTAQGLVRLEPMTAKEIDDEEVQDSLLNDPHYLVEEKLDGVRLTMHFYAPNNFRGKEFKTPIHNEKYLVPFMYGTNFWWTYCDEIYTQFINAGYIDESFLCGLHDINSYKHEYVSDEGVLYFEVKRNTLFSGESPHKMSHITFKELADFITNLLKHFMLYPQKGCVRMFSRRTSDVTGWLSENTDLFPHFRDLNIPELRGTILDGEIKIMGKDFGNTSSIINSNPDRAISSQLEYGFATYNVFDITHYRGIDIRSLPLKSRKVFLRDVVSTLYNHGVDPDFFVNLPSYNCTEEIPVVISPLHSKKVRSNSALYSNLYSAIKGKLIIKPTQILVNARGFYEFIVSSGGEGVMVKPLSGHYYSKRGREYQKIKKIISRDMIVLGFTEPTKEYTGKFPNDSWDYWESPNGKVVSNKSTYSANSLLKQGYTPLTRHYFEHTVGNMILGVAVTPDEEKALRNPKNKKNKFTDDCFIDFKGLRCAIVCQCSGYTDEMRSDFTENPPIGKVAEIKANEIFKDTGRLRHPRFLRLRDDKDISQCTFKEHISQ